jgi:hypothetical protein
LGSHSFKGVRDVSEVGGKVDMDTQIKIWHSFNKFMVRVGIVGIILTIAIPYIVVF